MRIPLPEIGLGGATVLSLIAIPLGLLLGIHHPWWLQIAIIAALGYVIENCDLELGAVAYLIPWFAFAIAVFGGDISWWIQTGGTEVHFPDIKELFLVK